MLEEGTPLFVPCSPAMPGAFVSIHLEGPPPSRLSICEAFVYTDQALPIESCPSFRDQPLGGTSSYNGKCYIFYDQQPLDFAGARRVCASRGGSLVDETSPALQGFLSWELWRRHRADPQGQYWLGAIRNPQDPNNWKWINGRDVTVSFWNLPGGNNNCSRFDGTKGWLWSDTDCHANLHFICQHRPVRCGIPERPPNSTILTTSDFTEGTMVEYRCGAGHILVGSSSRVCLPNGFYTETTPFCRYLECGLPAGVDNGEVMLLNGTMYLRSVARYTCQEGFELEGRAELSCDVDERWDGPPPRCRPTWCQPPPQIANGAFRASGNSSRLTVGTVLEYACRKSGFRLVGPKKLTCRSDGRWDNRPPNCTEIPGGFSPPKPETTTLPMATPVPAKTTTTTATATTTTFSTPTTSTAVVPDLEPSVAGSVTTAHYVRPYFPEAPPTTEKTERYEPPPAPAEVLPQDPVGSSSSESDGGDMWLAVPSPSPPALPPRNDAIPSSVPIPDPKKPDLRMEPSEVDAKVKEEMTTRAPIEPDWSGNEPGGSLQESESDNEIGFGVEVAGEGRSNTRLNLGGIIALSVFGALVLVAAILTMTVVMCRRSRRLRASADNTTVSTDDSLSSEGRGLNKYYKRAWENLRGSSDAVKSGHRLGDATDKGIGHTHRSHAQQLSRQETLDAPNYRTTTSNPGTIEGLRDTNEMTVSDATAWNTRKDRKRHHHHHHHRHNHRHRHSSPDSLNGRDSNWHDRS